jgi:[ribosomal protein S5]-alanine N-acetyltransferase
MIRPVPLTDDLVLRELDASDAPALAAAYTRNRLHLAAWEPVRDDAFFTEAGQAADIDLQLASAVAGASVPFVLDDTVNGRIVGRFSLSGIVRGPFQSANLGYWVDGALNGRGLATAAVGRTVRIARDDLRLHRLQAATLPHNVASQRVLVRNGFERIGFAPRYLQIAGNWQDHDLFQAILHD